MDVPTITKYHHFSGIEMKESNNSTMFVHYRSTICELFFFSIYKISIQNKHYITPSHDLHTVRRQWHRGSYHMYHCINILSSLPLIIVSSKLGRYALQF